MKKLRLDIEQIVVSGFDATPVASVVQGSVHGAEFITKLTLCNQLTCFC